jgi:hypothetical protein
MPQTYPWSSRFSGVGLRQGRLAIVQIKAWHLLTSVELGGKLDLGLNELELLIESHLGKLDAQLELAALLDFVLVLHVGVHVAKEELLVVFVSQAQTHSLIGGVALQTKLIVRLHDVVQDGLIEDLHLHLEGVVADNSVLKAAPLVRLRHKVDRIDCLPAHDRHQ